MDPQPDRCVRRAISTGLVVAAVSTVIAAVASALIAGPITPAIVAGLVVFFLAVGTVESMPGILNCLERARRPAAAPRSERETAVGAERCTLCHTFVPFAAALAFALLVRFW